MESKVVAVVVVQICLLTTVSSTLNKGGCECRWTRFNESCYLFVEAKVNWLTAVEQCNMKNAHLVRIESKVEYNFLKQKATTLKGCYWTDGTDEEEEGVWRWSSNGQKLKVTDWYPGEPNNVGKVEHCLVLGFGKAKPKYQMVDFDCNRTDCGDYICEKEVQHRDKCDKDFSELLDKKIKELKYCFSKL